MHNKLILQTQKGIQWTFKNTGAIAIGPVFFFTYKICVMDYKCNILNSKQLTGLVKALYKFAIVLFHVYFKFH